MKYCFDIDGTLCETPSDPDGHNVRYWDSQPYPFMIEQVNRLYDEGHKIIMMLSLIHISEPTRPLYISYAVFCLVNYDIINIFISV